MNNNFRYILAGVLIFMIILLQPVYLKWLGYNSEPAVVDVVRSIPDSSKIEDLRVGDVAIDEEVEVLRRSLEN